MRSVTYFKKILSHVIVSRLTHPFILPELTKSVQGIRGEIIDWLCSLETVETYPYKGTLFFLKKNLVCICNLVWLWRNFFLSSLFQSYGQFYCPRLLCNQLPAIRASDKTFVNSVYLPGKNSVTSTGFKERFNEQVE